MVVGFFVRLKEQKVFVHRRQIRLIICYIIFQFLFFYYLIRKTILKSFIKKCAFNRYKIVCKISNIRVEPKKVSYFYHIIFQILFFYRLKRKTILKMLYYKKYAFNKYKIVCKISNIRVERKNNYWIKCWQTPIILSPSKCLNNQNI